MGYVRTEGLPELSGVRFRGVGTVSGATILGRFLSRSGPPQVVKDWGPQSLPSWRPPQVVGGPKSPKGPKDPIIRYFGCG